MYPVSVGGRVPSSTKKKKKKSSENIHIASLKWAFGSFQEVDEFKTKK